VVNIGLPSFIIDLSGILTAYGIVIGIFSVTQSVFQFQFAAASDKYGRRLVVLIGLIVYIIGTFLCFIAQDKKVIEQRFKFMDKNLVFNTFF